jgi:hypothetical protein
MKNTQKGARCKSLRHYYPISRVFSEYFCSGMSHPESSSIEDNLRPSGQAEQKTTNSQKIKPRRKIPPNTPTTHPKQQKHKEKTRKPNRA